MCKRREVVFLCCIQPLTAALTRGESKSRTAVWWKVCAACDEQTPNTQPIVSFSAFCYRRCRFFTYCNCVDKICCCSVFVGNRVVTIWMRGPSLVQLALISTLNLQSTPPAFLEILQHCGMTALSLKFLSSPEVDKKNKTCWWSPDVWNTDNGLVKYSLIILFYQGCVQWTVLSFQLETNTYSGTVEKTVLGTFPIAFS